MPRGGQRGYGNAGRTAYSGGTSGGQSRAVLSATSGLEGASIVVTRDGVQRAAPLAALTA